MSGNPNERELSPVLIEVWLGRPAAARYFDPAPLNAADRERFTAMRNPRRREEFKISRALRAHAGQNGSESLSHSGGFAAFARAPAGLRIGIDLEVHRHRDVLRTARNVFSINEIAAIATAPEGQRERLFYSLWTMKEALAKALQLNLVDALRLCTFQVHDGAWEGRVPSRSSGSVVVFEPERNMYLAAACIGEVGSIAFRTLEWPPQLPAGWPVIARVSCLPRAPSLAPPLQPGHASSRVDAAVLPATAP